MSTLARSSWPGSDPIVAAFGAVLVGSGLYAVYVGASLSSLPWALVGAGGVAVALFVVFAAGWVQTLPVVAVCLALPPAYSSPAIRLGPALLVTLLAVGAGAVDQRIARDRLRLGPLPVAAVAVFLFVLVISAGFAVDRGSAARETANLMLFVAFLVVATDSFIRSPSLIPRVARLLGWVAGVAGGFAVLEAVGVIPGQFTVAGTPFSRATGGFAWPNELAMYLAISLPFAVYLVRRAKGSTERVLAGISLLAAVAGLAATFSRGSWVATLVAPAVLILAGERRLAVRVWAVAAIAAVVLDVAAAGAVSDRVVQTLSDPLVGQRFALTYAGVLMFVAHPWVGIGPGGFEAGLDQFGLLVPNLWDFVGSAHNTYVHLAAETGIFGLLAFVWFLVATWRVHLRNARGTRVASPHAGGDRALAVALLWAFTAACVIAVAEWTLTHGVAQLIMLVAAMGYARRETPSQ